MIVSKRGGRGRRVEGKIREGCRTEGKKAAMR